jgi:phage terminase large subunit-like protein
VRSWSEQRDTRFSRCPGVWHDGYCFDRIADRLRDSAPDHVVDIPLMPVTHRVLLHSQGPALWPAHKSLDEILELQATTPEPIWNSVYQGSPTSPGGTIFKRQWWRGKNRYDSSPENLVRLTSSCIGRWISWDTAMKDTDDSAYTADVVGELRPNYQLAIREVWRERLEFPELPSVMGQVTQRYNWDGKLRGVLIEDKASGTSAYQTLRSSADNATRPLLIPFMPVGDKNTRANQAAVWCRNDCILLPEPSDQVSWLLDFEEELFGIPSSLYRDQGDAFAQLVIYTENYLAEGFRAHGGARAA